MNDFERVKKGKGSGNKKEFLKDKDKYPKNTSIIINDPPIEAGLSEKMDENSLHLQQTSIKKSTPPSSLEKKREGNQNNGTRIPKDTHFVPSSLNLKQMLNKSLSIDEKKSEEDEHEERKYDFNNGNTVFLKKNAALGKQNENDSQWFDDESDESSDLAMSSLSPRFYQERKINKLPNKLSNKSSSSKLEKFFGVGQLEGLEMDIYNIFHEMENRIINAIDDHNKTCPTNGLITDPIAYIQGALEAQLKSYKKTNKFKFENKNKNEDEDLSNKYQKKINHRQPPSSLKKGLQFYDNLSAPVSTSVKNNKNRKTTSEDLSKLSMIAQHSFTQHSSTQPSSYKENNFNSQRDKIFSKKIPLHSKQRPIPLLKRNLSLQIKQRSKPRLKRNLSLQHPISSLEKKLTLQDKQSSTFSLGRLESYSDDRKKSQNESHKENEKKENENMENPNQNYNPSYNENKNKCTII